MNFSKPSTVACTLILCLSMALWDKNMLQEAMDSLKSFDIQELKSDLNEWLTRSNRLGLLDSESIVRMSRVNRTKVKVCAARNF